MREHLYTYNTHSQNCGALLLEHLKLHGNSHPLRQRLTGM